MSRRPGMTEDIKCEKDYLERSENLDTDVSMIEGREEVKNKLGEELLGRFCDPGTRMALTADLAQIRAFEETGQGIPSFLEAGPRKLLRYSPEKTSVAIVTTGGLCPGLHRVIHSIVTRHYLYGTGSVYGVYDSFKGLVNLEDNLIELDPIITDEWADRGGSRLGNVRYYPESKAGEDPADKMVADISEKLKSFNIDILYIIGGDGSLRVAHQIAKANPGLGIVGIPKTMDNDILWVWQSFGFRTVVEKATSVINTLHIEAASTRRICLIELFGAESGFVAANASLASGHVDLVLIPEVFSRMELPDIEAYLDKCIDHIARSYMGIVPGNKRPLENRHNRHALVVVAEGVGTVLEERGFKIDGKAVKRDEFTGTFKKLIESRVKNEDGLPVQAFINQPRHNIRAIPPNPQDQIYCERLGVLAVDNALAGYTDFMISQWLAEYVLVPLEMVNKGQKGVSLNGMFWKQVIYSTCQPLSAAELVTGD